MPIWRVVYFRTKSGNIPVRELIESQGAEKEAKILAYITELELKGNMIDRSISKKITRNLFELKVSDVRLLYYFGGKGHIVIVLGVVKKRQDPDSGDIKLAEKNRKEFMGRFNI